MKIEDSRIKIWENRIEKSKSIRKKYFKKVKTSIDFYKGNQWGNKQVTLSEKPVINMIFSYVKTQVPYLYFQNPKWYCRPKKTGRDYITSKQNAKNIEFFLNYYVKENLGSNLKSHLRLAILDAFFCFGVIKTGYIADFEANINYGRHKILGEEIDGTPIYEIDKETGEILKEEEEEILTHEAFFSRRISPASLLFDSEAENFFETGRYIIEEIVKPLQDVKNSKLYENTKNLEASYNIKPSIDLDKKDKHMEDDIRDDLKRIALYEIYDLEHDKLFVMAEGHNEFIREQSMPKGIDKSPYSFLRFNEVPEEIYPMSDLETLKPIQEEYNLGRAMVMTHAKRFGRKYGYTKETFAGVDAEIEMEKLKDPEDGMFFEYSGDKMPEPLKDAPLDAAVYANFEQTKVDFREVSGFTEYDRGLVERRKTAYEASQISLASNIRKEDRKALVEEFASNIGKKLVQSMQANLTFDYAKEIMGENTEWQNFNRNKIIGEFDVGVEVGTLAPAIPEYERKEMFSFLEFLARMPPELIQIKINFEGLIDNVAKYFPLLEAAEILNDENKQKQIVEQIQKTKMMIQQSKQNKGNV